MYDHYIRYTNAPKAYDYQYVQTLATVVTDGTSSWGSTWRKIAVSDLKRFNAFQVGRYGSGGYWAQEEPPEGWTTDNNN